MNNYEHLIEQVKNQEIFSNKELTDLRKKVINQDFKTFEKLFQLAADNEDYSHLAKTIVILAPRYLEDQNSIKQFEKYLENLNNHSLSHQRVLILQMSSFIMNNKKLPAIFKFKILENSQVSYECIRKIPTHQLFEIIKEFERNLDTQLLQNPYNGFYQTLIECLERTSRIPDDSLSNCIQKYLEYIINIPNERSLSELVIKAMIKSPNLDNIHNDALNKALECWKYLEQDTYQKYVLNQHHQTKKRLTRLQDSYLIIRDLFRKSLENKDDVMSKLDALLMG